MNRKYGMRDGGFTGQKPQKLVGNQTKLDANKDGKLDKEERKLLVAYRKAEFMKRFDKNGDGKICDKEKKAAAEAMRDRRGPRPDGKGPRGKGKGPKPGKKPAKKK